MQDRYALDQSPLRGARRRRSFAAFIAVAVVVATGPLASQDGDATPEAPPEPTTIQLNDGSEVQGDVVDMGDGTLNVKTKFAGDVPIDYSQVKSIDSKMKLRLLLEGGSELNGTVSPGTDGHLNVTVDDASEPISVPLTAVAAINPPPPAGTTYTGLIQAGGSINDGNTRTKTGSVSGEFIARNLRQRFTASGAYNYAEDTGSVTARNARGQLKYDFFVTERLFIYASSLFEGDSFQDLKLRTALSAGLGYQLVNKGDFDGMFAGLDSYVEGGVAYFSEDYDGGANDDEFVTARWAFRLDWEVVDGKVTIFHNHEGFPSLEHGKDIYIITHQGVRLTIWNGFFAAFSVQWRWDNTPAPGRRRSDTLYLASLGYAFEL